MSSPESRSSSSNNILQLLSWIWEAAVKLNHGDICNRVENEIGNLDILQFQFNESINTKLLFTARKFQKAISYYENTSSCQSLEHLLEVIEQLLSESYFYLKKDIFIAFICLYHSACLLMFVKTENSGPANKLLFSNNFDSKEWENLKEEFGFQDDRYKEDFRSISESAQLFKNNAIENRMKEDEITNASRTLIEKLDRIYNQVCRNLQPAALSSFCKKENAEEFKLLNNPGLNILLKHISNNHHSDITSKSLHNILDELIDNPQFVNSPNTPEENMRIQKDSSSSSSSKHPMVVIPNDALVKRRLEFFPNEKLVCNITRSNIKPKKYDVVSLNGILFEIFQNGHENEPCLKIKELSLKNREPENESSMSRVQTDGHEIETSCSKFSRDNGPVIVNGVLFNINQEEKSCLKLDKIVNLNENPCIEDEITSGTSNDVNKNGSMCTKISTNKTEKLQEDINSLENLIDVINNISAELRKKVIALKERLKLEERNEGNLINHTGAINSSNFRNSSNSDGKIKKCSPVAINATVRCNLTDNLDNQNFPMKLMNGHEPKINGHANHADQSTFSQNGVSLNPESDCGSSKSLNSAKYQNNQSPLKSLSEAPLSSMPSFNNLKIHISDESASDKDTSRNSKNSCSILYSPGRTYCDSSSSQFNRNKMNVSNKSNCSLLVSSNGPDMNFGGRFADIKVELENISPILEGKLVQPKCSFQLNDSIVSNSSKEFNIKADDSYSNSDRPMPNLSYYGDCVDQVSNNTNEEMPLLSPCNSSSFNPSVVLSPLQSSDLKKLRVSIDELTLETLTKKNCLKRKCSSMMNTPSKKQKRSPLSKTLSCEKSDSENSFLNSIVLTVTNLHSPQDQAVILESGDFPDEKVSGKYSSKKNLKPHDSVNYTHSSNPLEAGKSQNEQIPGKYSNKKNLTSPNSANRTSSNDTLETIKIVNSSKYEHIHTNNKHSEEDSLKDFDISPPRLRSQPKHIKKRADKSKNTTEMIESRICSRRKVLENEDTLRRRSNVRYSGVEAKKVETYERTLNFPRKTRNGKLEKSKRKEANIYTTNIRYANFKFKDSTDRVNSELCTVSSSLFTDGSQGKENRNGGKEEASHKNDVCSSDSEDSSDHYFNCISTQKSTPSQYFTPDMSFDSLPESELELSNGKDLTGRKQNQSSEKVKPCSVKLVLLKKKHKNVPRIYS